MYNSRSHQRKSKMKKSINISQHSFHLSSISHRLTIEEVKAVVLLFPEDWRFSIFSVESSFNLLHVVYGDSEHINGDLFMKFLSTLTEFSELVVSKLIFSTLSKILPESNYRRYLTNQTSKFYLY